MNGVLMALVRFYAKADGKIWFATTFLISCCSSRVLPGGRAAIVVPWRVS